jgi:hypothetical protein
MNQEEFNIVEENYPQGNLKPGKTLIPKGNFIFACFVCLLFVSTSVFFLCKNYIRDMKWLDYDARVTESQLVSKIKEVKTDSGQKTETIYTAVISYEYFIDDATNTGKYKSVGSSIRSGIQKIVDQHPVGSIFKIKVNPDNKSESTAEGMNNWFWWVFLGFSLVMSLLILSARKNVV